MSEPFKEHPRESGATLGARVDDRERAGERCAVCPASGACDQCFVASMSSSRAPKQDASTSQAQSKTILHYFRNAAKDPARAPSKSSRSTCSAVGASPLSKRGARACDSGTFLWSDADSVEMPLVSLAREFRGPSAASARVAARRPVLSCALSTTSPLSKSRAGDARRGPPRVASMPEFTPVSIPCALPVSSAADGPSSTCVLSSYREGD